VVDEWAGAAVARWSVQVGAGNFNRSSDLAGNRQTKAVTGPFVPATGLFLSRWRSRCAGREMRVYSGSVAAVSCDARGGAQQFLAAQWGVDKSTVSRWLSGWEAQGHIRRQREGRCKQVALPPAKCLVVGLYPPRGGGRHRFRTSALS
jgi:hypothetical protein